LKGFSPVCERICSSRRAGRLKAFPHPSTVHLCTFARGGAGDRGVSGVKGVLTRELSSSSSSVAESTAGSGDSIRAFLLGSARSIPSCVFGAIGCTIPIVTPRSRHQLHKSVEWVSRWQREVVKWMKLKTRLFWRRFRVQEFLRTTSSIFSSGFIKKSRTV